MSARVGFGVIGANSFVANAAVLPAIDAAPNARLVATASRSGDVPERWVSTDVGSYEAVLEHPDVEAVYVPLPNGMHREWTEKAAAAGKHVLCEKPLAADAATAQAMADACGSAGVILAEAWMTPFSRRYAHLLAVVENGDIGNPHHVHSAFTFTIGDDAADNYRWDPDQGGGALLDVGIYCLGAVVELFGADPSTVFAVQQLTPAGVDASTTATLVWQDERVARIRCSFVDDEEQSLDVGGPGGTVVIDTEAFTGGIGQDAITRWNGREEFRLDVENNDPYRSMVESFAAAVRGEMEWPRPVERSIEMLALIERIKEAARD